MSISRDELVNIFTVVSFLAHAEKDVHVAEKKVLIAVFKAAGITQEEQNKMKSNTSLEEMLKHIQSVEAKHTLVELMALVAASDGKFEDEERVIIKKIMKRVGVADDHPYFDDNNLDVPSVRANVGKILNSIKTLAPKP
ncbi:MAG: TerB family tellurite resistance protein [Deltaproteobacteria bacterium]|jgi:tellurite resistance protein|nr:TerB family tellurite resistance protein [Deltaproteobacteria bacterium]MDG1860027.1 TerB family tellurite resistance protein [SAR324 cluster bacterium]MBT4014437.1 TerB family tellurite resistance protein [Deltaproteobacteria bacterium]MBT4628791.1 TerB family tellurite resistance protein [Deltaproteobacteria bacterium]MBT5087473.1 TerB family tellurite resistance protein [Deltaproteobacteria bacterium]|tara:strand:- start:3605 stop:4021 length:417 start_codon:yes stop_codon:yes gene_type:complete